MKLIYLSVLLYLIFPFNLFATELISPIKGSNIKAVVFAGGCFWCMQPPFDSLKNKGVISTAVGYSGGDSKKPTYEQVSNGGTGHYEAIQITYDSKIINLAELLAIFWKNIDPFDAKGQFCDKGDQYLSAVFYADEVEKKDIEVSIKKLQIQGINTATFATKILPFIEFYQGEEYHQSYYEKNPVRYKYYRFNCGRDKRLKEVWGTANH